MEALAVFRSGKWIQYVPRIGMTADPRITETLRQKAAAAYGTALQKGFQEERAHILAETIVFKNLYEELILDKRLEADLRKIMDHGEKA